MVQILNLLRTKIKFSFSPHSTPASSIPAIFGSLFDSDSSASLKESPRITAKKNTAHRTIEVLGNMLHDRVSPVIKIEEKIQNKQTILLKEQQHIKCKYMETEHRFGKNPSPRWDTIPRDLASRSRSWRVVGSNPIWASDFFRVCVSSCIYT